MPSLTDWAETGAAAAPANINATNHLERMLYPTL
jgi:hypothetical protein